MYLFKKIVSRLFFPVFLIDGLLVLGVLGLWSSTRVRMGKILVTTGVILLLLLSYRVVPNQLLGLFEYHHPPLVLANTSMALDDPRVQHIKWVVALSGGGGLQPDLPLTSQLSSETIVRVVEGIRLIRFLPNTKLLISGGEEEALLMTQLALDLGVEKEAMLVESEGRDTKDQANNIRLLIGDDPIILVTSASHMPRSVALFEKQGFKPLPAPTGHLSGSSPGISRSDFFPSAKNLMRAERATYELLGITWAGIRGQI
jgi:uncharacterized SAM-binding protein YcdF (DUF218 family)